MAEQHRNRKEQKLARTLMRSEPGLLYVQALERVRLHAKARKGQEDETMQNQITVVDCDIEINPKDAVEGTVCLRATRNFWIRSIRVDGNGITPVSAQVAGLHFEIAQPTNAVTRRPVLLGQSVVIVVCVLAEPPEPTPTCRVEISWVPITPEGTYEDDEELPAPFEVEGQGSTKSSTTKSSTSIDLGIDLGSTLLGQAMAVESQEAAAETAELNKVWPEVDRAAQRVFDLLAKCEVQTDDTGVGVRRPGQIRRRSVGTSGMFGTFDRLGVDLVELPKVEYEVLNVGGGLEGKVVERTNDNRLVLSVNCDDHFEIEVAGQIEDPASWSIVRTSPHKRGVWGVRGVRNARSFVENVERLLGPAEGQQRAPEFGDDELEEELARAVEVPSEIQMPRGRGRMMEVMNPQSTLSAGVIVLARSESKWIEYTVDTSIDWGGTFGVDCGTARLVTLHAIEIVFPGQIAKKILEEPVPARLLRFGGPLSFALGYQPLAKGCVIRFHFASTEPTPTPVSVTLTGVLPNLMVAQGQVGRKLGVLRGRRNPFRAI